MSVRSRDARRVTRDASEFGPQQRSGRSRITRHASRFAVLVCGVTLAVACHAATPSISGIWFPDPTRSERLPKDAPYTKEGRALVDEWRATHHPTIDDPGKFCQAPGMPSLSLGGADYPVEIVETSQQVLVLTELHQQVRRIFMNAKHPEDVFPQRNGHSIGKWDGDALVVETVGIRGLLYGAVPHSDQVRVVERWKKIDKGASLVNEITVHDPVMFTKPVVLHQYYKAGPPDARMMEYECTEGMWEDHEREREEKRAKEGRK